MRSRYSISEEKAKGRISKNVISVECRASQSGPGEGERRWIGGNENRRAWTAGTVRGEGEMRKLTSSTIIPPDLVAQL